MHTLITRAHAGVPRALLREAEGRVCASPGGRGAVGHPTTWWEGVRARRVRTLLGAAGRRRHRLSLSFTPFLVCHQSLWAVPMEKASQNRVVTQLQSMRLPLKTGLCHTSCSNADDSLRWAGIVSKNERSV